MPLEASQAPSIAKQLLEEASTEWQRLAKFARYQRGDHADPYTPKRITPEFMALKERSKTNLIPNVISTLVDRLYVDGYRPDTPNVEDVESSPAWHWWQRNGMDARQNQLYEHVARYGYGWMMVWPSEPGRAPWMRPKSPRTWYGQWDALDDDFPRLAVRNGASTVELLDDEAVWVLSKRPGAGNDDLTVVSRSVHGLGVVPLVRYMNGWPDEGSHPVGEVEKLIDVQDRLNQTVFDLLVTQTYMGAPQQYIAGVVADADDKVKAIAKRIWTFDSPETEVGQLPQADLSQLIRAIDNAIRMYGIKSQMPPNYLLGEMVNISADALVAAHADLDAKVENRQGLHAESHERTFNLAGAAAGDAEIASDPSAQVIWRRTDPRSMSSVADAVLKLRDVGLPVDEAIALVPGFTQQDVARITRKIREGDPLAQLEAEFERQASNFE